MPLHSFLSGPELTTDGRLRTAISATLWAIQRGCIEELCGQLCTPPFPPPANAHHLCHILFWLGFAGPAILCVAKTACCHDTERSASRKEQLWAQFSCKDRAFGKIWKPTFLEYSAIPTGTWNFYMCVHVGGWLCVWVCFLTCAQIMCQEVDSMFTNFSEKPLLQIQLLGQLG